LLNFDGNCHCVACRSLTSTSYTSWSCHCV